MFLDVVILENITKLFGVGHHLVTRMYLFSITINLKITLLDCVMCVTCVVCDMRKEGISRTL